MGTNYKDPLERGEISKVINVYIEEDATSYIFETISRIYLYDLCPECCAEAWLADINGLDNLLGKDILSIEYIPLVKIEDKGDEVKDSVLEKWGLKIKTTAGYCDFVYKCSHNGYYGADVRYNPEFTTLDSIKARWPDRKFKKLTEDLSS